MIDWLIATIIPQYKYCISFLPNKLHTNQVCVSKIIIQINLISNFSTADCMQEDIKFENNFKKNS